MSGQIFISYRHDDSSAWARLFKVGLSRRFPQSEIFMDVDTIEPGVDYVTAIENSVDSCEVLIAVIGKRWLTCFDKEGGRRIDDPEDAVRLEIATALRRNIRVIPILVDSAFMPRSSDLPDDLKLLVRRNALNVSHDRFDQDLDRLAAALERVLEERERLDASRRLKEKLHLEAMPREKERDPFAELRNMEGMGTILEKLEDWNASRKRALRQEQLQVPQGRNRRIPENILLLGNPGTGKSTVAKLIADGLRMAKLSGPKYKEVSPKDLIDDYVGRTGGKTADVCRDALGGVLFIDEADAIAEDEDFGLECLSELKLWLKDEADFVCIMAGYKESMQRLLGMNPGLPRLFGCVFHLPDYNVEQLLKITQYHATNRGTELDAGALSMLRQKLEAEIEACRKSGRLFSNAGFSIGLLKSAIGRRALRLRELGGDNVVPDKASRITAKDIAEATFAEGP